MAAGLLLAVSGCSGGPGSDAAAGRVAAQFSAAVTAADTGTACDLLAAGTRSALETESGSPCPDALRELALPGGELLETQAFGRAAESRLDSDVVFLTLSTEGWQVAAAGCTPHADRPYSCDLKGE